MVKSKTELTPPEVVYKIPQTDFSRLSLASQQYDFSMDNAKLIWQKMNAFGISDEYYTILLGIAFRESGMKHYEGKSVKENPASGATGMFQILQSTGAGVTTLSGEKCTQSVLENKEKNVECGMAVFRSKFDWVEKSGGSCKGGDIYRSFSGVCDSCVSYTSWGDTPYERPYYEHKGVFGALQAYHSWTCTDEARRYVPEVMAYAHNFGTTVPSKLPNGANYFPQWS